MNRAARIAAPNAHPNTLNDHAKRQRINAASYGFMQFTHANRRGKGPKNHQIGTPFGFWRAGTVPATPRGAVREPGPWKNRSGAIRGSRMFRGLLLIYSPSPGCEPPQPPLNIASCLVIILHMRKFPLDRVGVELAAKGERQQQFESGFGLWRDEAINRA
jgi:hypothetical protein